MEFRIADEPQQIGIGQLFGFDHDVERIGGRRAILRQGKAFHDVQHLEGAKTLAVWRKFVNGPITVRRGNRIDPFAGISGEISGLYETILRIRARDDSFTDVAPVKCTRTLACYFAQRAREVWVSEDLSRVRSFSVREECLRGVC